MKKTELDERQKQQVNKAAAYGFYTMFVVAAVAILVQLGRAGSFKSVIGETIIFISGGLVTLFFSIRSGAWTRRSRGLTLGQNALISLIGTVFFTAIFAWIMVRKAGSSPRVYQYILICALIFFVFGFLCLFILNKVAVARRAKEENKYSE